MSACLAPLKDEHPEMRHLIEVHELEWHRFLGGPMPESIEILDALHGKGVPLYGLTNWPHQVWPPHRIEGVENPDACGFLGKFRDLIILVEDNFGNGVRRAVKQSVFALLSL